MKRSRTIKVDSLARVEGEGKLYIKVKQNAVQEVRLNIFEAPRFFEAFLQGRHFTEVPSMVSRICGICPVAHQMAAVQAMEQALGIIPEPSVAALRRVFYLGEWIESHALHIYLLHAPDFVGAPDAIAMTKTFPHEVEHGLQLKKVGNEIMTLLGGRSIHPINLKVGGFYKAPQKSELAPLIERLKWAKEGALQTVRWVMRLPIPEYSQPAEFVALSHPTEYPVLQGRVISSGGLNITANEYPDHFVEEQVAHSNALHSRLKERGDYLVGPLARYNLNFDQLSPLAQQAAFEMGLSRQCVNPFQNILVRTVEMLYAFEEALRLLEEYQPPSRPAIEPLPYASAGYSCTEAPRGLLHHFYRMNDQGLIEAARIIPPTAQNQSVIEADLKHFVIENLDLPQEQLTWKCEQIIRNYDPCLSCATHFLKLEIAHE